MWANPMHSKRVTLSCGFRAGGVIGPYIFENVAVNAVTVNGKRYSEMIKNFLWAKLGVTDLENKTGWCNMSHSE